MKTWQWVALGALAGAVENVVWQLLGIEAFAGGLTVVILAPFVWLRWRRGRSG